MQQSLNFDAVTFSAQLSQEAKREGLGAAVWSRKELLWKVKEALKQIALSRSSRTASADDGQEWLMAHGYQPSDLGNAAGAMFSGKEWECVGRIYSTRVSRHANEIRLWRLR